jgi:hypothetical protein
MIFPDLLTREGGGDRLLQTIHAGRDPVEARR